MIKKEAYYFLLTHEVGFPSAFKKPLRRRYGFMSHFLKNKALSGRQQKDVPKGFFSFVF